MHRQETPPLLVQGSIPLCSRQYDRLFNSCRIPGLTVDKFVHFNDSTHVVVLSKGKFYRLGCYDHGRLLEPVEIEAQIDGILKDASNPDAGEEHLPALTASDRTSWAQARKDYFRRGQNRLSLTTIETAAFFVVLDDYEYDYDKNDASQLSLFGRALLHGKGYDRWFDKSFQFIVGSNGRIGVNTEHSWADAPIISHYWEYILYKDDLLGYDANGRCRGQIKTLPPRATKLRWDLPAPARDLIAKCKKEAELFINDFDLHILNHDSFGKAEIKKCKTSPDAFIQMALQLAYARQNEGRQCMTYESSMTRLFREGRTETVRPCTKESSNWVKSMLKSEKNSVEERKRLFQKAVEKHQLMYKDAMTGKGIEIYADA